MKKTENNITELVFILDKSGSMAGLESDTIGGFNSLVEKQKKLDGQCYVSTVLFDSETKVVHDRVPISEVEPMTEKDYSVGGCTALIDAIGGAMKHIDTVHRYIRREDVPSKTMFVITTDGMENASKKYTSDEVKRAVERHKELGWEFLFFGANIDAIETAKRYGISKDRAVDYTCDAAGTAVNFAVMEEAVCAVRCGKTLKADWKKKVEEDHKNRK
ncbi:MAG: VWA domain-containing protein [Clostridia bacterium]|nr:VWA domain-containing protein [Clostridia bacterium]